MAARKKIVKSSGEICFEISNEKISEAGRDAIEKDRHLLQAALAADKIIVTLDDKLQRALESTPKTERVKNQITWVHPVRDGAARLRELE